MNINSLTHTRGHTHTLFRSIKKTLSRSLHRKVKGRVAMVIRRRESPQQCRRSAAGSVRSSSWWWDPTALTGRSAPPSTLWWTTPLQSPAWRSTVVHPDAEQQLLAHHVNGNKRRCPIKISHSEIPELPSVGCSRIWTKRDSDTWRRPSCPTYTHKHKLSWCIGTTNVNSKMSWKYWKQWVWTEMSHVTSRLWLALYLNTWCAAQPMMRLATKHSETGSSTVPGSMLILSLVHLRHKTTLVLHTENKWLKTLHVKSCKATELTWLTATGTDQWSTSQSSVVLPALPWRTSILWRRKK